MFQRIGLFILSGTIVGIACALTSLTAYAQSATKSEGTTFVGRGGKVTITDKHGAQVVEGGKLRPVNRITTVTPAPAAPAEGETAASTEAKPAETTPTEATKPEGESKEPPKDTSAKPGDQKKTDSEAATATVSPEEAKKKAAVKAAEQAAKDARKQKDIERLRNIQQTGGWFYTKDGKAISNDELNERIKKGKVEDIKATDIYEEQYSTDSSKDASDDKKKTTK